MPEQQKGLRQKVDDFFTNYLRNTTSDQEILNFYGEGNIIGRKGIPATDRELVDSLSYSNRQKLGIDARPKIETNTGSFGVLGEQNRNIQLLDIPNTADTESGLPWQMQVEEFPISMFQFLSLGDDVSSLGKLGR